VSETEKVEKAGKAKPIRCVVTSDKMNKSRVAVIERLVKHGRYEKHIRRTTKVMFHDAENQTRIGDLVLVSPSRPMSARKKFKLDLILKKAPEQE